MRPHLLLVALLALAFSTAVAAAGPEPPVNVSTNVSGNTVTVTWQPPPAGSVPLGYLVDASLSPGGAAVASFLVIDPTLTINAVPNGVFYLRVRAGNAEGLSAPSSEVVVAVPGGGSACTSPPDAPTNLTASIVDSLVTLNWLAPAAGCAATAYVVQAGSTPGASDLAIFNVGAATTLSVDAPPGTYFVRVVAVNASGGSTPSNELTVTVQPPVFDLSGTWSGTSDYINAPFEMMLTQQGTTVFGSYQDQKDPGGAFGQLSGSSILIDVNFGDTGIRFEGTVQNANRITGTIFVPVLGGRRFTFEMTR